MGLATFIGGIHPFEGKELSEDKPIKYLEPLQGEVMVYPLSQHIGAPAKPLVAKGDHVLKGQIIAEAGGFISANVLSSVSGTVKGIESKLVANGAMVQSILVENDGEEEAIEGFGTDRDASKLSKEEIRQIVKDAGIVGLGLIGGSFARGYAQAGVRVLAWDPDDDVMTAASMGTVAGELNDKTLGECDIIVLACYPEACIEWLETHAKALADATDTDAIMGPVVIDTVGVKGIVCERAFELAREHGFYFVGAHPMAGTQFFGLR